MSFPRSLASRSVRQFASTTRASGLRQTQRLARRNYASATDTAKKGVEKAKEGLSSDLPWLLGALAVTVPGTYLILNGGSDSLHNPLKYPLPGANNHDHHGDEEHDEEHEEEEGGEEEEAPAEEEEGAKSEGGDSEDKGDESEEKPAEGGDDDGEGKSDEQHEADSGDTENKTVKYDDAKGGVKRRVESGNAIELGQEQNTQTTAKGSPPDDAAAPTKEPVKGATSGKQAGLSNTDTKHSTDIANDPEKSKKGEGVPETAKMQGTVDPGRPQK